MSRSGSTKLEIRDTTCFDNRAIKKILSALYRLVFRLLGWKVTPILPNGAGITIAAPHTSNWDFFYAFGAAIIHDTKIYFSIKESWCRVPLIGSFILYLGGIPIDRSRNANGQVEKIQCFIERNSSTRVFFLFTPEGTRNQVERWKTGFYHVAISTGLPVFLAKVDYGSKETGVFHSFIPTGDMEGDIAVIQASYSTVLARFPGKQYPSYQGPLPELSLIEQKVVAALYGLKEKITCAEIMARCKLKALSVEVLEFLVARGILEQYENPQDSSSKVYRLSILGGGLALHMGAA